MSRVSLFLLLGALALSLALASLPASESSSFDCRTLTPTPTVTGTPWPTPPWTPYSYVPVCNDTAQAVSDLHVRLGRPAVNPDPIGANAPGCPEPVYFFEGSSTAYTAISIDWGTPCVHPGEMVTMTFFAGCQTPEPMCLPPDASCFYWTLEGQPMEAASAAPNPYPCDSPEPVPTGTPAPTGPCERRGAPPVTYAPTPTPATPTPTPGLTSRDVVIQATIPFCNDAGKAASDLHVRFAFPYSFRTLKANPAGCPEPAFGPSPYGLDTFDLEADWGVDCVDPGESLTIEFIYACGDVPCHTPAPYCYTWTRFGEPVYQGKGDCLLPPTPTPTPTPTATPGPPVTPTPTPTAVVQTGTPTPTAFFKWGDTNCSGGVDSLDALRVLAIVARLVIPAEVCAPADVDCDGDEDAVDALKILRFVVGLAYSREAGCQEIGGLEG